MIYGKLTCASIATLYKMSIKK